MAKRDYYDILGVKRGADDAEIRKAYRKLAKRYHPDRNRDDKSAEAKFKEVQEAYDVLGDKERRRQYDRFGHAGVGAEGGAGPYRSGPGGGYTQTWSSGPGGPGGIEFDLGDLEEALRGSGFGGGGIGGIFERFARQRDVRAGPRHRARSTPQRGQDVEHEVTLSFEQAVHGTTLEVDLSRTNARGAGGKETIRVRVPAGVEHGQRIRVRGKGLADPGGGKPGDMYIVCRISPHAYFTRIGSDIYLDVPITITEACLGTKVKLPTIDGTTLVTIPPGTASGRKLRLKGKGVMNAKTGQRGDHYAVIRIVPPPEVTDRQRSLLAEFDGESGFNPRASLAWQTAGD
ncbi:MAG: J domain-containing protein [Phycisphaerae bacterium]|nr:J domain-containing protein [Phycisphaerae bacterium]